MLRTLLLFQENLQIHTITRHMRCEQIGKRRDTSVDIMAYRGRLNIGMPIMRRIIQPIIKSSRRMKRKVAIFICIVLLGSSCYEPGERGLFLNNKSGYELTCFVADEINSGFRVIQTHCFMLIPIHSVLQIAFLNQVGFLVEKEIGNPFCLLHIPVCCLFICLSKKMWII